MILIDTGPIVALLNSSDPDHKTCAETAGKLREVVLVTTWPCFTEAMYLLYREGGLQFQEALWKLRVSGVLHLHLTTPEEEHRMRQMMLQYADSPMDLADASLVASAEALSIDRIFTIDRHFHAYRLASGAALQVVP